MKCLKLLATMLLASMMLVASSQGWAHDHHRGHARIGVFIGAPLWPWYYPYPYYYYPPVITVPAPPPPVYIEQGSPPAAAQSYWYYCTSPDGYYPYVKECPGGWQKVLPQP